MSEQDPTVAHTFDRFVAGHENGDLNQELTDAIREITEDISNHYQAYRGAPKATLTITFEFQHASGHIQVSAKVKKSLPAAPRTKCVYYATEKNQLTRRDPKQHEMPFRDVNGAPPAVRTIT